MINNLKLYIIVATVLAAIFFITDWKYQKREKEIQLENTRQLLNLKNTNSAELLLSKKQISEYIKSNLELQKILRDNSIKPNRVEKIVETRYEYIDNNEAKKDVTPIVEKIRKNTSFSIPIIDSTKCLVIKGSIDYSNDSLSYKITSRVFNNKTTIVGYWERKQWKFLFIKSRLFGKIQAVTKVHDECGNSKTQTTELNNR